MNLYLTERAEQAERERDELAAKLREIESAPVPNPASDYPTLLRQFRALANVARYREIAATEANKRCWELEAAAASLESERAANAILTERLRERDERNTELERLCDDTYVAKGADAYSHACERMEQWQEQRRAAGKPALECAGLCDHLEALRRYLEATEREREELADRLREIEAQEPVAWQWLESGSFRRKIPVYAHVQDWRPLYAAPVAPRVCVCDERWGLDH